MTEDTMIAGLLREREAYVQQGLDDRVAQVDEQLKLRGYQLPEEAAKKSAPSAKSSPTTPKGRRQKPAETA
ncbi:hypothetical protein [Streptomyces sp900116325]|uniref:hypothetical protein n=1 Tax=Streptomyces sp. 900116325 TaxID=3154295 RepID=UPI0033B3E976